MVFSRWLVHHRLPVAAAILLATLFFAYPIANTVLTAVGHPKPGPVVKIGTDPRDLWPDHPYMHAQDAFSDRFGRSSTVIVLLAVNEGTIFNPDTLEKLDRVTEALDGKGFDSRSAERAGVRDQLEERGVLSLTEIRAELERRFPPYPVNHDQVTSLTHPTTRYVTQAPNGDLEAHILVPEIPSTQEASDRVRERVWQQSPELVGRLISNDEQAAVVMAGFVTSRLTDPEIHRAVFDHLQSIKEAEEDGRHRIYITGQPILIGWVLVHLAEIGSYLVIAFGGIFALLWLSFRRWHGVVIPLVAALATVIWGTGFTGWVGIPFDPLVLVVPMLITARAISHSVQMAERFFEDYATLRPSMNNAREAKREAAGRALGEMIVPGTLGVVTDAAGLLAILVTTVPQMRNLAITGAFWVGAIIVTVEILHPILISLLPPPKDHCHTVPPLFVGLTQAAGSIATHPIGRYAVLGMTLIVFLVSGYAALFHSRVGDASPGAPIFWPDHEFNVATGEIAKRFGGVDTFAVYLHGDRPNASASPESIRLIEEFERWMRVQSSAQVSISLAPVLKNAMRQLQGNDPKFAMVPAFSEEMLQQIRLGAPPNFLRNFISDDQRDALITLMYPDHRGNTVDRAMQAAAYYIARHPTGETHAQLDRDRAAPKPEWLDRDRWVDVLYYLLGPLLPPRHHTLRVVERTPTGYRQVPVHDGRGGLAPDWLDPFRSEAIDEWRSVWPERLRDWEAGEVSYWWKSPERGVRGVVVHTRDLIVQDLRSVEPVPTYQPTKSWTRGVSFVLAGGTIGTLAAITEEVERAHVANITLILVVIFALHSLTYRSAMSGAIILLQLATATLIGLAYMAIRGLPLNIHTLPVQSVAVGIGVDYAIYIVDRIRQEVRVLGDVDAAIRRAVSTTGFAVTLTAITILLSVVPWSFSNLRFQGEMAQLLAILLFFNMLGAIIVVPALYSIFRPRAARLLGGAPPGITSQTKKRPRNP